MLQSMGLQRVGQDLATEQQQSEALDLELLYPAVHVLNYYPALSL